MTTSEQRMLEDHEARLRVLEAGFAESRWRIESLETAVKKAIAILERLDNARLEQLGRNQERADHSTALSRRQILLITLLAAVVSPTLAAIFAHIIH